MRITSFVALSAIAAIIAHESLGVPLNKKEEDNDAANAGMMAGVGIASAVAGGVGGFMVGKTKEKANCKAEQEAIIAKKNEEVDAEKAHADQAEAEKNHAEEEKNDAEADKAKAEAEKDHLQVEKEDAQNQANEAEKDKMEAEADKEKAEHGEQIE